MRALLGRVFLVVGFLLSSLEIYCATLFWPAEILLKKSADYLMGIPLYAIYCFSLVAFNVFSLYLIFVSDYSVSQHVLPWVYLVWDSLHFLDLGDYFLSHVREVSYYNLFKYFLRPFLFLFFFWAPYN